MWAVKTYSGFRHNRQGVEDMFPVRDEATPFNLGTSPSFISSISGKNIFLEEVMWNAGRR